MNYLKIVAYSLFFSVLISCQSKLLTVHKIDVQQGNALDVEMVDKVKIGMTQDQVQFVLGSPLITDSFHPERWDYIYLFTPGYGEQEKRQLTLIFDRGEVIEIDKHNIESSSIASDTAEKDKITKTKKKNKEKELSEKEEKDQKIIEKQADTLNEVLKENKNPDN
jgi:outer membrane protein assembly factor BamE